MSDEKVTTRILAFMRKIDADASDEQTRARAMELAWLDKSGAPTTAGRALIRSFEDLDQATTLTH